MNYLVQRAKVRQQAINVPDGLPELLSDITREVLRCQPAKECLCQFIIDYLQSLIISREKVMVARTILDRALRKVDDIISDMCICDISKEKSEMMAQTMEECFRNFLERVRCERRRGKEMVKFEEIDLLEELIAKCKFTEHELDMSRPVIESAYKRFVEAYMAAAEGADGTEILYQYFRDRELQRIQDLVREQAATRIQALYRGYRVRAKLAIHVCTCVCKLEETEAEIDRKDKAARVIQKFVRDSAQFSFSKEQDPCEVSYTERSEEVRVDGPTVVDEVISDGEDGTAAPPTAVPSQAVSEHKAEPPEELEPKIEIVEEAPAEAVPEVKSEVKSEAPAEAVPEVKSEVKSEAPADEPEAEPPPVTAEPSAVKVDEAPAEEAPAEEAPAEEAPAEPAAAEEPPPQE